VEESKTTPPRHPDVVGFLGRRRGVGLVSRRRVVADLRRDSRARRWWEEKTPSVRCAATSPGSPGEESLVAEVAGVVGDEDTGGTPVPRGEGKEFAAWSASWWARSAADFRVARDWRWVWDSMTGWRAALMDWIASMALR
tara:strand:- start:54853 stop:55272 length:420 start_codon:yes stop_codon:yes gene_type:complete